MSLAVKRQLAQLNPNLPGLLDRASDQDQSGTLERLDSPKTNS